MKPHTTRPPRPGTKQAPKPKEPIRPDWCYPLEFVHFGLGWGPRGLAAAKRRGLRVYGFSRWRYIRGEDLIAFIVAQGEAPPSKPLTEEQMERRRQRRAGKK